MRVSQINTYTLGFKGKVYQNYNKIAREIDKVPYSSQEAIIGNINTLKDRLESQTPDWKTYIIDFDYNFKRESKGEPIYHSGVIKIKDEKGNTAEKDFYIGKTGGSRKEDRTELVSDNEIWENGFKEITKIALSGLNESEKATEEIDKAMVKRYWRGSEIRNQIKDIYDKIEDRAKVNMDKGEIAASIYATTSNDCCPYEIQEAIIGNINTLTKRVEEETSKEKQYNLIITNNFGYNNREKYDTTHRYHDDALEIYLGTNADSYQSEILKILEYDNDDIAFAKRYCITDSELIYSKVFKPITEKTLWNGHNYLPFEKNNNAREIVNKLS